MLGDTVKKIVDRNTLLCTLEHGVKTCVEKGAFAYLFIKCVPWVSTYVGAFYIFENFLKNFLPEPNIGDYPFGTLDEREILTSSVCRWKGEEVNSYEEIFFQ